MSKEDRQLMEVSLRAQLRLSKEQHDAYTRDALIAARDGRLSDARDMYKQADSWWMTYLEIQRKINELIKQTP